MISSISTALLPLMSNGLHALTGRAFRAMLTPAINSLMPTVPLPSQSPGHAATRVGLGVGVIVGGATSAVAVTVGVTLGVAVGVAVAATAVRVGDCVVVVD